MACRAQSAWGEGVAQVAELSLGASVDRRSLEDFRAEQLAAEAGIVLGLGSAELMVDVERAYAVAEGPKRMPEAGRVRTSGDEAHDLPVRRDEVVPADVLFDPRPQRSGFHELIVGRV